jgi:hypothetical protein
VLSRDVVLLGVFLSGSIFEDGTFQERPCLIVGEMAGGLKEG